MFSGHLWHIFWPMAYFVVIWYIFSRFGILHHEKTWQPWFRTGLELGGTLFSAEKNVGETLRVSPDVNLLLIYAAD
jgi:hypothetical protein